MVEVGESTTFTKELDVEPNQVFVQWVVGTGSKERFRQGKD